MSAPYTGRTRYDELRPLMTASGLHRQPTLPLYKCIKGMLHEGILSGRYAPTSLLPSEAVLGKQFNASRVTAYQALADLRNEGLIFRHHGKGAFVGQPKVFQNVIALQGFAEVMPIQGHAVRSRMLKLRTLPAPINMAQALQLAPGTAVAELYHMRLFDQMSVPLEVAWLPELLGSSAVRTDLVTRDVFLVLEQDAGVAFGYATLVIDVAPTDHATTTVLETGAGVALLRMERLTHDIQGMPIDSKRLYLRDDAFQYRLRLDQQVVAYTQPILLLQDTK